jgi:hypothetical protein
MSEFRCPTKGIKSLPCIQSLGHSFALPLPVLWLFWPSGNARAQLFDTQRVHSKLCANVLTEGFLSFDVVLTKFRVRVLDEI